jgi:hypothetical protein
MWCEVGIRFHASVYGHPAPFEPATFFEKTTLSILNFISILVKHQLTINVKALQQIFYSSFTCVYII